VDEAREQATAEYDGSIAEWRDVPPDIQDTDLVGFALSGEAEGI
jgi:hypothetical protein